MGNNAPTIVVQNQLVKVDKLFAFPRSRIGNTSAQTTQTTFREKPCTIRKKKGAMFTSQLEYTKHDDPMIDWLDITTRTWSPRIGKADNE